MLSRGLLSGSKVGGKGDIRNRFPRFIGTNYDHNRSLIQGLEEAARNQGISPARLAIAWALSKGDNIVPLIGARTRDQLSEALGALDVSLSAAEIKSLEDTLDATRVAGTRYDERQMKMLDSER